VVVPVLLVASNSLWPAVIVYHALCLGAPLAFRCFARDAGLVRSDVRLWLPLTLALSVLLLAGGELGRWVGIGPLLPAGWQRLLERAHPWWAFVTYSLVVNAFSEEYLWRGFLLPKTGVALGAALFWLMHATAASVFVGPLAAVWLTLPALLAGLAWGWMRQKFGTLWPCLFTHLAADVAVLRAASGLLQT
jgi:membrane protease YdiL (CAAX protease family)